MSSIELDSVSVEFPVYHMNARSIKNQILRFGTGGKILANAGNSIAVKALDNITLRVEHGDRIGLLGHNGAGKSTLLRVLAHIYEPTAGKLTIKGKVSPLLDIMFGIDTESTGYENIMLRGILLGLTRKQIEAKTDEIAEFTGLGSYLSVPIRTYSAGMKLRLAFGVATSISPEILILDEVFGAGDQTFFDKAKQRMQELIAKSSIVVLASHSRDIIEKFCNKILLLEMGKIKYFGDVAEGMSLYLSKKK
jgi:ABC-2 type transport system ATP-binding protein/lipopolysaccharide transport system ATP-binding protein